MEQSLGDTRQQHASAGRRANKEDCATRGRRGDKEEYFNSGSPVAKPEKQILGDTRQQHASAGRGANEEATRIFAKNREYSYNTCVVEYYVYILASKRNGTLYAGMTKDIAKRAVRHKDKRANQFAAKYDVDKLVYYEKHKSLEEAVKREKQLKKWRREWKLKLIEKRNPDWKDLFGEVIKTK